MMKNKLLIAGLFLWSFASYTPAATTAPRAPSIDWMPTQYEAPVQYKVTWNMWWGTNGNRWHLLENGQIIHTADLSPNGQNGQTGSFTVNKNSGGEFSYVVKLCIADNSGEDCSQSAAKTISVSGGNPINQPPVVNAGSDLQTEVNLITQLNGSYSDDGIATPVSASWQVVSGPGTVSIANQNSAKTSATFASAGDYVLRLTVNDTEFTVSDELIVTVSTDVPNQPPVVSAGNDLSGNINQSLQLSGSFSDDGKSSPIIENWKKISGPGIVNFSNATSGTSNVTFDAVGNYVLEYSVNDSEFTVSDQLMVAISDGPAPEAPGTPSIAWFANELELINGSAILNVRWDLWSGVNGNEWRLLENGRVVHTASLAAGSGSQSGSYSHSFNATGNYELVVRLCNVSGGQEACSDSAAKSVKVWSSSGWPSDAGDYPHPLKQNNVAYDNSTKKMVAAYFVEWGIYGRNFHVADIPDDNLTHIFYGFVPICGANESLRIEVPSSHAVLMQQCQGKQDFEVVVHDKFAALEKLYPGDQDGKGIAGIFGQLHRMKLANPAIKVIPSVGGWTLSDPLYEIGINPNARKIFINSMMQYLRDYPIFDGVDIDWEFPGGGGANSSLGTPEDGDGFADLMIELRAALDALSVETGRTYELTAAVSGGVEKLGKINWERAHVPMDYINVMVYDYAGAWNNELGHQASLYQSDLYSTTNIGFNGHDAIQHLIGRNVPPGKITMGVAMYGRGWQGVTGAQPGNPFAGSGNGGIKGTWQDGIEDYKKLEADFMNGPTQGANGFELSRDPVAKAEYLWNPLTGTLITLDTERSVKAKGAYVLQHQLGGVFAWEIDADNGRILNAMHEGLGHPKK
ncbi:glycosyl hydrolase family 18 protein [Aliikangiella sp. G2MR2-5]|uniref:glycosyl hydrolase family 18 protein n=1 Tax=Aliikangiella sp. G2MR2-5 TaxID=2788943 RepID=UPI0018AB5C75|nr:glycosyl hydrolase family 18 protein [Aliikangiella sp. G2MR2-5]